MLASSLSPLEQKIDNALYSNLGGLLDALCDLLAALVLAVIASLCLLHAGLRIAFGFLALLLWVVALLVKGLYWVRAWAVSRSSSSLHRKE